MIITLRLLTNIKIKRILKILKVLFITTHLFFISVVTSFAQPTSKQTVSGNVIDSITGKPIEYASVSIVTINEHKMVKGGITNAKGVFTIEDVSKGKYLLMASFVGYSTFQIPINIEGVAKIKNVGTIKLSKTTIELQNVEIKGAAIPVLVKEDTIEYNASSFVTDSNAVVEDLIKKLPGVDVDKDGKITAHGKEVTRVFVDGKPFFGGDTKTATKNLPVDMIDKVQIIDRKSDQSMFTQIDDGDVEKVLNLVVKPGKKNGMFGKATAGYGTDEHYDGSGMVNWFKGARQVSIIGTANNINNVRFSDFVSMDQPSRLSGSINFMARGGANAGARFFGGSRGGGMSNFNTSGLNSSWSLGTNFRDSIGNKISFTGSYMYTGNDNEKIQNSYRTTYLTDSTFNYLNNSNSNLTNHNHNINMEFDYRIDSMNSILFTPRIRITNSKSNETNIFESTGNSMLPFNYGNSYTNRDNQIVNINAELLYRHRFNKARRTVSISVKPTYKTTDSKGFDISNSYFKTMLGWKNDSVDQSKKTETEEKGVEARLSYTEPLSSNIILEFNYTYFYNNSTSDRYSYNFDPITKDYNIFDTAYSNHYDNKFINHRAGFNIRFFRNLWDYTLGLGIEPSTIKSSSAFGQTYLEQNVVNFSPILNINYRPQKGKNLRIRYRGSTNQPSLSQLQPVPDNSNPLYLVLGNPNLKPEFNNNFNLNYNSMDFATMNFIFAGIMFDNTINKIINQNYYDSVGRQITIPQNTDGYYALNTFIGFGKPIKKFIVNLTANAGYSNDKSYYSTELYTTQNLNLGLNTRLNYNGTKLIVAPLARINYNKAWYSIQNLSNTDYMNYSFGFDAQYELPLNFKIGSDITYTTNKGYGEGYNISSTMWNAFISKQLFKNKKGQLKFQVYDILKDNKSITRTTAENYVEDTRVNALTQFFMFSFSYSFSKFNGKEPEKREGFPGMRPYRFERGERDF